MHCLHSLVGGHKEAFVVEGDTCRSIWHFDFVQIFFHHPIVIETRFTQGGFHMLHPTVDKVLHTCFLADVSYGLSLLVPNLTVHNSVFTLGQQAPIIGISNTP